jgi:hypothetical protein
MFRKWGSARRTFVAVSAAAAVLAAGTGIAVADDVVVGADQTVPVGGSGSFQVYLEAEDIRNGDDTINNCNAGTGNDQAVTVSFATSNTALVAAPSSLTFTGCDDPETAGVDNAQTVNFSIPSNASVEASATLTATATGGRTLGNGNNPRVVGTFDPDSITITAGALANPCANVAAPTAPAIGSVPAVANGSNEWFTTTPTVSATSAGATVTYSTDNTTWSSTPPNLSDGATTVYAKAESFAGTTSCGVASAQREFKVDTVAPSVLPGDVTDTTWRDTSLSRDFAASDDTSGLADESDETFTLTASEESTRDGSGAVVPTVDTKTVTDVAGNSTTRSVSALIDVTDPYVSAGVVDTSWRNTPLSHDFTSSDTLSGLSDETDATFTLTASADSTRDASGQVIPTVVSKTVSDRAGNSVSRSVSAWIDATAPTVTCPTASTFVQGSTGTVTADVADPLSGAVSPTASGSVDTATIGQKILTITGYDNAGNPGIANCSYSVVYKWTGFFQPIDVLDNDANVSTISDKTVWNSVKSGSAVPVKFSLNGNQGLSILAAGSPTSSAVKCPGTTANVDPIETLSGTTSGLKYDAVADQYNYTWKTSTMLAGTCQRLEVKLVDGTSHYAFFKFTR